MELALTPAQMTTNLQTNPRTRLQAAGRKEERYTMHPFRVGGAASHNMDGMAMNVLTEYVGWESAAVARIYT